MTIVNKAEYARDSLVIDLTGPDGNAFVLMGHASRLGKAMGKDFKAICNEMMAGDYENLIAVFDREFGEVVTLLR